MRVSVILPCRNEARHLGRCLDSVLAGAWPRESLEVLVVDGGSDDGTTAIAASYAERHPNVHVLANPRRTAPAALNIGLARASGDVILRMDAHVLYPADYVPRLVHELQESGADNVGGRVETIADAAGVVPRAIARALSHPFGVGDSHFRIGTGERRWVDTVPFGCWRRELFARIGGFDEDLVRNQDDEFNARTRRAGGRVLLVPGIVARYFGRSTYGQLSRMFFQYGLYKPLVVRKVGALTSLRQLAPSALLLGVAGSAGLALAWRPAWLITLGIMIPYLLLSLLAAATAVREDGWRGAFARAAAFGVMHASYGFGYLVGLIRAPRHATGRTVAHPLPLSR